MSFLDVPPFDMLTGEQSPFVGFGGVDIVISDPPKQYIQTLNQAQVRLNEVFGVDCNSGLKSVGMIESTINQMWADGWNRMDANVNLFVTDFGCVITEALRQALHGRLVLRSETDLSHASIWWSDKMVEAFPFHATYKRLSSSDGQSLVLFVDSLKSLIHCG